MRLRAGRQRGRSPPRVAVAPRGAGCPVPPAVPVPAAHGCSGTALTNLHVFHRVTFSLACTPCKGQCWTRAHPLLSFGVFTSVHTSGTILGAEILAVEEGFSVEKAKADLENGKSSDSGTMIFTWSLLYVGIVCLFICLLQQGASQQSCCS